MDTQKENIQATGNEGTGRTHNSSGNEMQPAGGHKGSTDISSIDQQEGNMNNGTVGDAGERNIATDKIGN